LDIPAVALVSAGSVGVAWGLVRASAAGWTSAEVLLALVIGVVLMGAFVAWERRASFAMVPPKLFRSRAFSASGAAMFLMSAALISAAFLVSQYFQFALHYSPWVTGLHLLPWTATPLVVAPVAGAVSDRLGRRPIMVTGLLLQGLGLGWIAAESSTSVSYAGLVAPFIIAGVGISMALPTVPTAALNTVAPADLGKASGVINTLQRFGGVFGVAIVTAVFSATGSLGGAARVASGFRPALGVSAGLSVLAALSALAVGTARVRSRAVSPPREDELRLARDEQRLPQEDQGRPELVSARDARDAVTAHSG
jgi:MFS family permease